MASKSGICEPYLLLDNITNYFCKSGVSNSDLILLHINARSLSKNLDNIREILQHITTGPEIIGITETKISQKSDVNSLSLPGYNFFHVDSTISAGGVGIYVKSSLSFSVRHDITLKDDDCESVWIELKTKGKIKKSIVGIVYRHPRNTLAAFTDNFGEVLHSIEQKNMNFYITGDFNIDLGKCDADNNISNYCNMLSSYGCKNLINAPTRVTGSSASLLDHFYTNDIINSVEAAILMSDISDHFPLLAIIKCSKAKNLPETTKRRKLTPQNIENFVADIAVSLNPYYDTTTGDVNAQCNSLINQIVAVMDRHMPLEILSRKNQRLQNRPWITKGILSSIKTRNILFNQLVKCKFQDKKLHQYYKSYRNKLTHVKEASKRNHYASLFAKSNGNSKATWDIINQIICGKQKASKTHPHELKTNNLTIKNSQNIVDALNKHFTTIGYSLVADTTTQNSTSFTSFLKNRVSNSIVMEDTNPEEISLIISALHPNKSPGNDGIPIQLLKAINFIISPILSDLINQSFASGTFPDILKIAKVIPLHKGGDKSNPSNYRPISILPHITKIFEKVIYRRLADFFDKYNVLSNNQFGFRCGNSTTLAIADVYENLTLSMDNGQATCAVLLDLAKAFDSVNHDILFQKLEYYGIRGIALKLLTSYFSCRKQFVSSESNDSSMLNVTLGVPQGSVLGPLFFLVYINDFHNSTDLEVRHFADDTLVYFASTNVGLLETVMNHELIKIQLWLDSNKLRLNAAKTKFMIFSPKSTIFKHASNIKLQIGKQDIELVNSYKYLGVILDSNLNWKSHVSNLVTKLSRSVGMMFKLRHYLNKNARMMVFNSLFLTHVRYGILCWGRANKTTLQPLTRLLNKMLKCINFCSYQHVQMPALYKACNVLQLDDICKLEICKFMFKLHKQLLPKNFSKYFTNISSIHGHQTRWVQRVKFFMPRKSKLVGQQALGYYGNKAWNELPQFLKQAENLKLFSSKLKFYIIKNYLLEQE